MSGSLHGAPQYVYNNIRCVTTGKTELSEECFVQDDDTHFM